MVKMSNCQTVLFKTPKIQHYLQNGWQNNRKYLHPPRRMYFILFVQLNNIVSILVPHVVWASIVSLQIGGF